MGVIGPNQCQMFSLMLVRANKYKDPLNKTIPAMKNQEAVTNLLFLLN